LLGVLLLKLDAEMVQAVGKVERENAETEAAEACECAQCCSCDPGDSAPPRDLLAAQVKEVLP
jgi:hypothetical protein